MSNTIMIRAKQKARIFYVPFWNFFIDYLISPVLQFAKKIFANISLLLLSANISIEHRGALLISKVDSISCLMWTRHFLSRSMSSVILAFSLQNFSHPLNFSLQNDNSIIAIAFITVYLISFIDFTISKLF